MKTGKIEFCGVALIRGMVVALTRRVGILNLSPGLKIESNAKGSLTT